MTQQKEDDALQDLHPELTLLTAELLGNLSALRMPYNIQNLLGNWLQLLGQIILVFNAQQQLWENGPGRCYSCCNKTVAHMSQHTDRAGQDTSALLEAEVAALRADLAQLHRRLDESVKND